jgi:hypothetical protein
VEVLMIIAYFCWVEELDGVLSFFMSMADLRFLNLRVKKTNSTFNIGDAESKI